MNQIDQQVVKLSERSTILSSKNSFEIQIYLLILIIYECTEKQSSAPYNKLSFVYSAYMNDIPCDFGYKTKDLIPSWPICELKKHIIYGETNKLWEVKVKCGKVVINRTKRTNEMYVDMVENKIFNDALIRIRDLCKIPASKIDRQRLV